MSLSVITNSSFFFFFFLLLSCNLFCEYFTASHSFTSWWTFTNLILEPFFGCNSLPMFPLISFYNENRRVDISPEPTFSMNSWVRLRQCTQ